MSTTENIDCFLRARAILSQANQERERERERSKQFPSVTVPTWPGKTKGLQVCSLLSKMAQQQYRLINNN